MIFSIFKTNAPLKYKAKSVIKEHRPHYIKRLFEWHQRFYIRHFIEPQFTQLGKNYAMLKPWSIEIYGAPIRIGDSVHLISNSEDKIRFTVLGEGSIELGDYVLICPSVRISSAASIKIGNNCMVASHSYLTDADWHGIYDRTQPIGNASPIVLEDNVWIGDSVLVCKGVTIGENSIIGAGAVVASNIPANSIAVGNPAKVVKKLDPDIPLVTRKELLDNPKLEQQLLEMDKRLLSSNSFWGWLRTLFMPKRGD